MEKGSRTPGWEAHGWEVQPHRHPGTASRCRLLGGTNCRGVWRGGPGKGGPLVRTGGRRPNLEVAGEEELPQPLLSTAAGREGELARWAAAQEGRKENRGRRVWEPWKGVPGGEFVSADDHITGKKSLVTVGPGQNLCKGWYSVLRNWKWPGAPGSGVQVGGSASHVHLYGAFQVIKRFVKDRELSCVVYAVRTYLCWEGSAKI